MATTEAGAKKAAITKMLKNGTVEFYVNILPLNEQLDFYSRLNVVTNAKKTEGIEDTIEKVFTELKSYKLTPAQKKIVKERRASNKKSDGFDDNMTIEQIDKQINELKEQLKSLKKQRVRLLKDKRKNLDKALEAVDQLTQEEKDELLRKLQANDTKQQQEEHTASRMFNPSSFNGFNY